MAIFVTAEEGDTEGLTNEVKESREFVGAAEFDDEIVFEDVCVPGNIVEESIDVELTEFVFNAVANDETEVNPDTVGYAVPDVETVFNPDADGLFVPLAFAVTVDMLEVLGEGEMLTVSVSIIVDVRDDNIEILPTGVMVDASVGWTDADDFTETVFSFVNCGVILFTDVNVTTEVIVG